jgi:hypothetical protein
MLQLCTEYPNSIQDHAKWLFKVYPIEVENLYQKSILQMAEAASDRGKYRKVCKEIKTFQKLFGDLKSLEFVEALRVKYPKRTAFLDELSRVK